MRGTSFDAYRDFYVKFFSWDDPPVSPDFHDNLDPLSNDYICFSDNLNLPGNSPNIVGA